MWQKFIHDNYLHPDKVMNHKWTLQGFGMLRTYLTDDKSLRLHIWDDRFATENVSTIHNHPWDFTSYVVQGVIRNTKYYKVEKLNNHRCKHYNYSVIQCGEGGGMREEPEGIILCTEKESRFYVAGDKYSQASNEIHSSQAERGTITICERSHDAHYANVYWEEGKEWVPAEPREATEEEIRTITEYALTLV